MKFILWSVFVVAACGRGPVADTPIDHELGYRQRLLTCAKLPEYRGGADVCRR